MKVFKYMLFLDGFSASSDFSKILNNTDLQTIANAVMYIQRDKENICTSDLVH